MEQDINQKLLRYIAIEQELKRRKKTDFINYYNNGDIVHKKQVAFHKNPARNKWVFGGNRSGKTECGAVEAVWRLTGTHPYRANKDNADGWAVSLSRQMSRDIVQKKIFKYLPKRYIAEIVMLSGSKDSYEDGMIDYIAVKNVFGGLSRLYFKSCDQGREKFQGASLDFVWIDEEPPKDIYEECRMRVIDKKGDMFVTMTPLKGQNWVHDEIYLNKKKDKNLWHIFMEWADNPYLDKDEIENLSSVLTEEELSVRRYGKFLGNGGLVYKEFDESVHIIEPFDVPKEWYDNISIDPGLSNPLSAHWYSIDYDGNVYVIAEHYEADRDIDYHAKRIKEISKNLHWQTDEKGRIRALIDSAANSRTLSASKSVAELFFERDILVNTKINKDVFSGIARVKNYLIPAPKPKLYIFSSCVNMIREFKSYRWSNNDSPVKTDDHAMDELRYYLMTKPAPPIEEKKKSLITVHKERLINKLKQERNRKM